MNRSIITFAFTISATVSFCKPQGDPGFVTQITEGSPVTVLDLRKTPADLSDVMSKIENFTTVQIEVKAGEKEDCAVKTAFAAKAAGSKVVIIITEDGADAPSLAVFPEDHISVINADRLANSGKTAERLSKEIWRGIAFALGGYASDNPCALKAVDSIEGLDTECIGMTCPPVNFKVAAAAKKIGIATVTRLPYATAVRRGVAPAPTNEVQKFMWDKITAQEAAKTNAPSVLPVLPHAPNTPTPPADAKGLRTLPAKAKPAEAK